MEDGVLLYTGGDNLGVVIPISQVSDNTSFNPFDPNILFYSGNGDKGGRLRRFKKGDISYIGIFNREGEFIGYYREDNFWKYNEVTTDKKTTSVNRPILGSRFQTSVSLTSLPADAKIYISHKSISRNGSDFGLLVNYGFKLNSQVNNLTFENLESNGELEADFINIDSNTHGDIINYGNYIIDKKTALPDQTLEDLSEDFQKVIFDIIYVLFELKNDNNLINFLESKGVNSVLHNHIELPSRYNPADGTFDASYHTVFTEEYFSVLRLKLIEFRYWLLNFQDDYSQINENDLYVYVVNLFISDELGQLDYNLKIKILKGIVQNNYWLIGDWYFNELNEEEAIVKIIRSIAKEVAPGILNYEEINTFLDLLNTPLDQNAQKTLYEILYSKIQDDTFFGDDGTGNKGQFVKAVYNLWLESKYNPYRDDPTQTEEEILDQALNHFVYTPYHARWQFEDGETTNPQVDKTAAPMLIDYESERVLLWYRDNFQFEFDNLNIIAEKEIITGTVITNSGNTIETKGYRRHGTYNIFQPIALKASDVNDTIIQMPVDTVAQGDSTDYEEFARNAIPVFYLKYVDDLGDYSDAKESIGTIIDIVLTFTGIGGAISNLRHLAKFSLIRKAITSGGLTAAEKLLLRRALASTLGFVEAISGVASLAHSLVTSSCAVYLDDEQTPPDPGDPTYQEYIFCQEASKWLLAVELASLSGDLLARRALKRATRRFRQSIPDTDTPNIQYNEIRNAVDAIDDADELLDAFLTQLSMTHPQVATGITTFTQEQKFALLFDTQIRPSLLDDLNAEPDLIEFWSEIIDLGSYRSSSSYLRNYRRARLDTNVWRHIEEGGLNPELGVDPSTLGQRRRFVDNGFPDRIKHITSGIHKITNPPNPDVVITNIIEGPNTLGYYRCKLRKRVGGGWENPADGDPVLKEFAGAKESTMFPDSWSDQRLREELGLALTLKVSPPKVLGTGNLLYQSILSDGTACEFIVKSNGELVSFYPTIRIF